MQKPFQIILIVIISLIVLILFAKSCNEEDIENIELINPESSLSEEVVDDDDLDVCSMNHEEVSVPNKYELDNNNWPDSIYYVVKNVTYLSEIEKQVIIEHNKCRTNPSKYVNETLIPLLKSISNNGTYKDSRGIYIQTNEGASAVEEAIRVLKSQKPLPMIYPKEYLYNAAKDHCLDHGPKSLVGHGGTDNSTPLSRVKKYNSRVRGVGENISYGPTTGAEIVRDLIVDDGVSSRGHRDNIFENYRYLGVAYDFHKGYNVMCVIDYEF